MNKTRLCIITIVAILSILLAGVASAHPGEVCKKISNGTLCTIGGRFHSLRCKRGYEVFPPGYGKTCTRVTRGKFQWEVYDAAMPLP